MDIKQFLKREAFLTAEV